MFVWFYGLYAMPACAGPQTKQELVRTFSDPAGDESYELQSGQTFMSWNQRELFVTVHKGQKNLFPDYIARIYSAVPGGFTLLKEITTGGNGYFRPPQVFWYDIPSPGRSAERVHVLQLTEKIYGTGSFTSEHVFEIRPEAEGLGLRPIAYVPAPRTFAAHLNPGEAVWKGENNQFSSRGLEFEFYIWRTAVDGNCCPSGGRVTGEYKLVSQEAVTGSGYRIEMDTFERFAYDHLNP